MSSDRALAIAAIRRFIDNKYIPVMPGWHAPALPSWRFDVFFYARGEIACRLIAPCRAESVLGDVFWRIPTPYVRLRRTWRANVHEYGLDNLPSSPIGSDVFVLHAEDHHTFNGVGTAKASWTVGGKKLVHGHLAWRRDEFEPSRVAAWAVGTTEARAIKKLAGWPETMRVHRDDADALGEIVL